MFSVDEWWSRADWQQIQEWREFFILDDTRELYPTARLGSIMSGGKSQRISDWIPEMFRTQEPETMTREQSRLRWEMMKDRARAYSKAQ